MICRSRGTRILLVALSSVLPACTHPASTEGASQPRPEPTATVAAARPESAGTPPTPNDSGATAGIDVLSTTPSPPAEPTKQGIPGGLARGTGGSVDEQLTAGDKAFFAGDLTAAQKAYEAAAKLAPKDPAPKVGLIRIRLSALDVPSGYATAANDRSVRALLADLEKLARDYPEYGPVYVERGRILLILGEAPAALGLLQRGVALVPGDPEAHSALGVALLATGHGAEAVEPLRRAAEIDPDNPDRLANLGTAYMMQNRVQDAIVAYGRAVQLSPRDARVETNLGTALLAAGRADEAVPYLERAVQLDPNRATALSNLGYAYQLRGDVLRAIELCRKALSKDERLGSAWINLGIALASQRKYEEAERAFRRALAIDPEDPRAQANLKDLEEARKRR